MASTLRICKGEIQAFTPDLKYAVTEDASSTLHLWDIEKDSLVYDFEFEDFIREIQLSPDGKRLVASNNQDVIRIWDLTTGQRTHTLRGNAEEVRFTWSPDGKFLAVSGLEHKIHIMDLENKRIHKELRIPTQCGHLSWSPDGKLFAVASEEYIYFLDANSGKPRLKNFKTGLPCDIQWNPTGKPEIVIRCWLQYVLLNLQNFEFTEIESKFFCTGVKYTPDGRFLLIGKGEEAQIYNLEEQKVVQSFGGHYGRVLRIACSDDMREIVATADCPDQSLMRWKLEKPKPVKTLLNFKYDERFTHAYTTDMKYLAHVELKKVCIRETATWKLVSSFSIRTDNYIHSMAFSPDGKLLAVADDETLQIWDWESKTRVAKTKEVAEATYDLKFSPDGKSIAGTGGEIFIEVAIWNWEDCVCNRTRTFDVSAKHLCWLPNGKTLLAFWNPESITKIDVEKERTTSLTCETDKHSECYFDGKYIVICHPETVDLLSVSTKKREKFLDGKVNLATVSPDSRWVVLEEGNTSLQIFDLKTKEKVQVLDFETNKKSALSFSPNGKTLLASFEKRIRLWNTKTWEIVQDLEFPQNVTSLEWSLDSQQIAVIYGGVLTVNSIKNN